MTLTERVLFLSSKGVSMDVLTIVFRSEHIPDEQIAAAYDAAAQVSETRVERGVGFIVPK